MNDYEEIVSRILASRPGLPAEEVEKKIEEKMRAEKYLNRTGAALLVAEDLGVLYSERGGEAPEIEETRVTKISDLVPGLNDVSVVGRVIYASSVVKGKDYQYCRMKIGDEERTLNVLCWGEKAEEVSKLGIKSGQVVKVEHGYTRARLDGRGSELHVGRRGRMLVVSEDEYGLPSLSEFLTPLSEAVRMEGELVDVECTVVEVNPVREVNTASGVVDLREVEITDGRVDTLVVAWRDKVRLFDGARPGEVMRFFDVRVRNATLQTTGRTLVESVGYSGEVERIAAPVKLAAPREDVTGYLVKALDVSDFRAGMKTIVAHDGREIVRIRSPVSEEVQIAPGSYVLVRRGRLSRRRGRAQVLVRETEDLEVFSEPPGGEVLADVDRKVSLPEVTDEVLDVVVEGALQSKTPPTRIDTRFGPAEIVRFSIRDGEALFPGVAWRSKALELDRVEVGEQVRLKWVRITRNFYGELEIGVEGDTVIEVVRGGG